MSRRAYDSTRRGAAAAQAQQRVLTAASGLMRERGYAATTVADIAAGAEVSVALIYAVFGNKAAVLKRVLDVAIAGDDEPVALRDRPAVAAVKAATSVRSRCELNAAIVADVLSRVGPLFEVVRDAAGNDPEVAALLRRQDQGRRAGMGEFVEVLRSSGQLKPGIDPDRATDIIWALTDPGIYHRLVVQSGWSAEQYRQWLAQGMTDTVTRAPRAT